MHARSKDKQDLVLQHYLDGHSKDFKSISFSIKGISSLDDCSDASIAFSCFHAF